MALDHETERYVAQCLGELPRSVEGGNVAFGFDGIVDRVRTAVRERSGPDRFERMTELREFGGRITDSAALDGSCSIEWIEEATRPGGHAAHLGRAFERLGYDPTLIGTFGTPVAEPFEREYDRAELVSVGSPSTTDAIEFDDGKVMLSETGKLATLDWNHLRDSLGLERLAECVDGTRSLGIGYWSTIPRVPSIWKGLGEELWPLLSDPPAQVLVDPGDVRRLSNEVHETPRSALATLDAAASVTVSANGPETVELAEQSGVTRNENDLEAAATALREVFGVTRFVTHTPSEAIAVSEDGLARVAVPRCPNPAMTTSAGDHFNAGLLLAGHLGLGDGPALVVANALAGSFVRNAEPPTYDEVLTFVETYAVHFE